MNPLPDQFPSPITLSHGLERHDTNLARRSPEVYPLARKKENSSLSLTRRAQRRATAPGTGLPVPVPDPKRLDRPSPSSGRARSQRPLETTDEASANPGNPVRRKTAQLRAARGTEQRFDRPELRSGTLPEDRAGTRAAAHATALNPYFIPERVPWG